MKFMEAVTLGRERVEHRSFVKETGQANRTTPQDGKQSNLLAYNAYYRLAHTAKPP